jgi:MFS family permease
MAGTLTGGLVVARISRRDDRWKLWAPAITSGFAGPVFAVCMLTPDFTTMVAAMALTSFLVGFHLGPVFAIAQTVARPSMRALASAILLTATCFGQGVGPLAVGMINDPQERLRRHCRALFAAVGRGHHHARRAVVRLGSGVHPRRYRSGRVTCRFALPGAKTPCLCRRNHFREPAKPS